MSQGADRSCEGRRDDLAAYALDALERAEHDELERHLADCQVCSERLIWLRPALDTIPASVPQMEPPPALREKLMETVNREAAAAPAGARSEAEPEPLGGRLRRWLQPGGSAGFGLRPALAGLAMLAIVAAGVGGYVVRDDGDSTESFAVLPTSPKLVASGTVEVSDGAGTLTVADMPPIPRDEVYQVWVRHDEVVTPSSIFVLAEDGSGTATIPDVPAAADEVLVTREPAGGSQEPHTAPILSARLG